MGDVNSIFKYHSSTRSLGIWHITVLRPFDFCSQGLTTWTVAKFRMWNSAPTCLDCQSQLFEADQINSFLDVIGICQCDQVFAYLLSGSFHHKPKWPDWHRFERGVWKGTKLCLKLTTFDTHCGPSWCCLGIGIHVESNYVFLAVFLVSSCVIWTCHHNQPQQYVLGNLWHHGIAFLFHFPHILGWYFSFTFSQ